MSGDLLQTKLFVPRLRPLLVPRPHLIKRLNQGLQIGHKLTLISAPAGFGKTTLASEWIGNLQLDAAKENPIPNRIAWLSLDENDNDLARFLTYFVAALNQNEGKESATGKETVGMLQSSQPPPTDVILTTLINELAAIPDRLIFILDDYHLIDSPSIDNSLTFLLEHLPPQMHLVIVTRDDPRLPLARLRARRQLTELRAADLRFSSSETAKFLNQMMGLELSAEDITALETRSEGWIAGLQLAALALQGSISMQGHENATSLIKSFTGSHRFVLDYLIEEVLDQQSEDIQKFLLKTAVLKRLTGSLCDALTTQNNGQTTLEILDRANLFIVPLDNERRWYRYHHLFSDLLNHRLRQTFPEQISELHWRASKWYEQRDMPSAAIQHALAAKDFERAANLAELAWPAMSGSFQSIEWLGWMKALPDELVRARPVLSVGYAWAFLNSGKLEAAEARLLDAERWLQPTTHMNTPPANSPTKMVVVDEEQFQSLPASLATARAYHAQAIGDLSGTVKYAQRVLDLLPEGDSKWRGDATALLALALWAHGDLEAAHQTLSDGLARMAPLDVIIGTFVLADIKMALGQLHTATRICERALQLALAQGEPMPLGTEDVYTQISKLHRERGDLETAAQTLLKAKELGAEVELPDWQYRWYIAQARLKETLGDMDAALDLLNEAERLYVRTPLPQIRPISALKARIWVAQNRIAEALSWSRERGLSADDDLNYLHEFEYATLARILIAQFKLNEPNGTIYKAMGLVERLLEAAEKSGRKGSVIEILVLQALVHEAQGNMSPAIVSLERALKLAETEGYLRTFVDEGPPMARLLYEALSQGIAPDYVQRLLAAFPNAKSKKTVPPKSKVPKSEWVEPLSKREIEVLRLIADGMTNQEIASKLYLSLHTVKVHAHNIYGKLGVKNRTQAVARARALGILTPS